jgi:hypothetical protein
MYQSYQQEDYNYQTELTGTNMTQKNLKRNALRLYRFLTMTYSKTKKGMLNVMIKNLN